MIHFKIITYVLSGELQASLLQKWKGALKWLKWQPWSAKLNVGGSCWLLSRKGEQRGQCPADVPEEPQRGGNQRWGLSNQQTRQSAQMTHVGLGKGKLVPIQELGFSWRFKLYGFVCFVLNHLLRQDRACEALPANTYSCRYGNIGGREGGRS